MPVVKRRYFILILILVLLLAGWSTRLFLAEFLITSQMKQTGLEDVTADISQIVLDQSQLPQLSFVLLTDSGRLTLDAQDITLSYTPGKLITGHLDTLEINRLVMHYEFNDAPAESHTDVQREMPAAPPQVILQGLRTALGKYLFFDELSVHQASFHGEPFSVLDGKSLSLISSKNDDGLTAELTLLARTSETTPQDPSADLSQLVINRLSKDVFDAELRMARGNGRLPAKIKFALNETDISGSYQLSPQDMQRWLQAVFGKKDNPAIDSLSDIESSNLNGTLSLNFENHGRLRAAFTSTAESLSTSKLKAENIALVLRLSYTGTANTHKLELLDSSRISVKKINSGTTAFSNSLVDLAGELTVADNRWRYKGTLGSKQIIASNEIQHLKLADVIAVITADAQNILAEGNFSPATLPGQFRFHINHDLNSSAGAVSITPAEAIELSAEHDKLSKILTPWPYPLDLYTGTIKLSANASWSKDKETRLSTVISLKDSGGNAGAIVFSGLSFDHQLEILPAVRSTRASEIQLSTVDSGVTISNISMSLAAKTSERGPLPRMIVRQTKGEIMGGSFTADDLVYDLNRSNNRFLIKLKNIDLAEIVKTQQLDNIIATGRLDGTLPVEITQDGINIAHGALTNQDQGGIIRYTPESGTEQLRQNPVTGITLDALKDFRYSVMQADVNYLPDGELTVNLALRGISPELEENRPVHLNINTEQNLVSLLKSLRFAQGVSDSIDVRVRRNYEKNRKNKVVQ